MLPRPNDIFADRYRVESELGRGGFASVFLATDLKTQQQVALKVLERDEDGYDRGTRLRLEREAKILAELRHPNIVELLDHGDGESLYMVFELVRGEDIAERLKRAGALPPMDVLAIIRQLLDALTAAHSAGILHRDIKPENVRITGMGSELQVTLLDFGIARATDDGSPAITKTGELIGTPRYMSPEQLLGQPLGPQSDIYALGILALEMLLGREAMHGSRWSDQLDRLHSGHVFGVPDLDGRGVALIGVIHRMTARDPDQRFQSAQAVLYALDTGSSAHHEVPNPDADPHTRRLPIVLGLVLAATAVAVIAWYVAIREEPPRVLQQQPGPGGLALVAHQEAPPDVSQSTDAAPDMPTTDAAGPDWYTSGCGNPPPYNAVGYRPQRYDHRVPHAVLVVLRDQFMSAEQLVHGGGFAELADREGLIVLTPEPEAMVLAPKLWGDLAGGRRLVLAELRQAMDDYCIDPGRVFVVGLGGGGELARRLSCTPWVAGSATYAHNSKMRHCKRPSPFLLLYPTKSRHQRVDSDTPVDEVCERQVKNFYVDHEEDWRRRNRCSNTGEPWAREGASCLKFDCDAPFVACKYDGGRHWPGAPRSKPLEKVGFVNEPLACDGPTPLVFDPTAATWAFFSTLPPIPRDELTRAVRR